MSEQLKDPVGSNMSFWQLFTALNRPRIRAGATQHNA